MQAIDDIRILNQVHGGNMHVALPLIAAAAAGATTNLMAWTIKTAYYNHHEEFKHIHHYIIEAGCGALIGLLAPMAFIASYS